MTNNTLKIEVKRIHKINGSKALKAFVDIVIADSFLVKGCRVVEGKDGLFVSMPQEQSKDNKWYESVVPLSDTARESVANAVLGAFQEE